MKPYYEDDLVTLYHGDCLEVTEWLAADVLVTDPPYGINRTAMLGEYGANMKLRGKTQSAISQAVANDLSPAARDAAMLLWGKRPAIVFGSWKVDRPAGTVNRLIWHKAGMPPGPARAAFMSQDEEIYIVGKGFRASSPPMRSVIRTDENRPYAVISAGHPTPKPIGLMEMLIDRCPSGVIADPFAGSGATLLAARNLGRKAIGVELEEKYCELIARRAGQQTFALDSIA